MLILGNCQAMFSVITQFYFTILKDKSLSIAMAHPDNDRLKGEERRTTYLLAIYPSLLITLTPGYFWYLSLHPKGPSKVHIRFGGGMSDDYIDDKEAQKNWCMRSVGSTGRRCSTTKSTFCV